MRIRTQLVILIVALISIYGAVVAYVIPQQVETAATESLITELHSLHTMAGNLIGPALIFADYTGINSTSELLLTNPNAAFVLVKDDLGEIVARASLDEESDTIETYIASPEDPKLSKYLIRAEAIETEMGPSGQLVIGFHKRSAESAANTSRKNALWMAVMFVLIGSASGAMIGVAMVASLSGITHSFQQLTEGKMAQEIAERGAREFRELASSFNTTNRILRDVFSRTGRANKNLGRVVTTVENEAGSVEKVSTALGRNVAEVGTSIEEIASQIQRVVSTTELLAERVQSTSKELDEMQNSASQARGASKDLREEMQVFGDTLGEILTSLQAAGNRVQSWRADAADISTSATESSEIIAGIASQVDTTLDTLRLLQNETQSLGREISDISNVVGSLQSLSDRTHILALNASIEAARAGQAGKGFNVVASEIRKLAMQSVESMRKVEETVARVRDGHKELNNKVNDRVDAVSTGMAGVKSATEKLSNLVVQIQSVLDIAEELGNSTRAQASRVGEISRYLDAVQSFTQDVFQRSEMQFGQSAKVASTMDELVRLSTEIRHATAEQYNGGQLILRSVQSIDQTARRASDTATALARTVDDLVIEQKALDDAVSFYRDADDDATRWS